MIRVSADQVASARISNALTLVHLEHLLAEAQRFGQEARVAARHMHETLLMPGCQFVNDDQQRLTPVWLSHDPLPA